MPTSKGIEYAIEQAVKGGWKPKATYSNLRFSKKTVLAHLTCLGYFKIAYFLDPLFWQCLGKAEGWLKYTRNDGSSADSSDIQEMPNQGWTESWKHHRNSLLDHIDSGKDIDDFFTNLLLK